MGTTYNADGETSMDNGNVMEDAVNMETKRNCETYNLRRQIRKRTRSITPESGSVFFCFLFDFLTFFHSHIFFL